MLPRTFCYYGFWFYPAMAVALLTLYYAALNLPQTLLQLAHYTRQPTYGFMIVGLITILVFSRLLGIKHIWLSVLGDNPIRAVKNIVEEGVEVFGYAICFMAIVRYFYDIKKQATHA